MSSAKKKAFNSSNKKKSPKTKKQKNSNLSSQVLSSVKRNHNFSEKFQINCSQSQDKKENNNNNANNENEEEFSIIQSLWDDLGVNIDYQEEFKSYINDLKLESQKNEIINYEKNHLRKLREALFLISQSVKTSELILIKELRVSRGILDSILNILEEVNLIERNAGTVRALPREKGYRVNLEDSVTYAGLKDREEVKQLLQGSIEDIKNYVQETIE